MQLVHMMFLCQNSQITAAAADPDMVRKIAFKQVDSLSRSPYCNSQCL
jgi:hypothetical protein